MRHIYPQALNVIEGQLMVFSPPLTLLSMWHIMRDSSSEAEKKSYYSLRERERGVGCFAAFLPPAL